MTKSRPVRILGIQFAAFAILLFVGQAMETYGQARDPFAKPAWARTREARQPSTRPAGSGEERSAPATPTFTAPPIEQRLNNYLRMREQAVLNGREVPKVTSILTLNEMSVTGIFKSPRGYAAIVEATPIKLSYTIYPGERFFDGQLVAIDENRLVFRKVTQVSKDKFVTTVENKPLRQYTREEALQGTAPAGSAVAATPQASQQPAANTQVAEVPVVSTLDAMERQAASPERSAPATPNRQVRRP